jgi:beta-N-acetylhexosaminidase
LTTTDTEGATERPTDDDAVLGRLMLAFEGTELPVDVAERLRSAPAAGVSLFGHANVVPPGQVRLLSDAIQAAAGGRPAGDGLPLIVAADQEGGQLIGLGEGTTPFAGNMAVAATGDVELAERVATATGRELRAMGVNVNYAPVCDLATNPANPAVGIRSFGDDPALVASFVAATVRGLQAVGVAAALKHFPGLGDVADDTHHGLASLDVSRDVLETREFAPFRAGIDAGARVVMSAHLAVPALNDRTDLPATLSPAVMTHVLRDDLAFGGVSITDALDMRALAQGPNQVIDVLAAIAAGVDLLLTTPDPVARERIEAGLRHAAARGFLDPARDVTTAGRVTGLRQWIASFEPPSLDVVGCPAHHALAAELAARAITLVRDDGRLPLELPSGGRMAAIMPQPTDQTPADTSSTVVPGLAAALRRHHDGVDEIIVAHQPSPHEIAAAADAVRDHDIVVLGTSAAFIEPSQAALANAVLRVARGRVITIALRTPFDVAAYPASTCHLSTYGILGPSLDALADVLFGQAPVSGRLPAAIPALHPTGHGIERR